MRVEEQVILLAGVQLLDVGASPAVAETGVVRVAADAETRVVEKVVELLVLVGLPTDAEGQTLRVLRLPEQRADRERQERVAIGGDRDEDARPSRPHSLRLRGRRGGSLVSRVARAGADRLRRRDETAFVEPRCPRRSRRKW